MRANVQLYWLRESASDLGTPMKLADLDPILQNKVGELTGRDTGPFILQLPFFDRRESRRRAEMLRKLTLVQIGRAHV